MYTPKNIVASTLPHEIIALIGAPGSGKTSSALTFPNRIWLDFDHQLPVGESSIPFWDPKLAADMKVASFTANSPANMKDTFMKWLRLEYKNFTPDQTVILDTMTACQQAFDRQEQLENSMMADDKKSGFTFWGNKMKYTSEIMSLFKNMSCRVVILFHEVIDRDKEGDPNGKLRLVMDGAYKDRILGDFSDVWRMISHPPLLDEKGGVKIINGKRATEAGWFWQLASDGIMNCKTNPTLGPVVKSKNLFKIKADYNELMKLYANNN
jgi:hypothetical protein